MESKCPACKKYASNYVNKILEAEGVNLNRLIINYFDEIAMLDLLAPNLRSEVRK